LDSNTQQKLIILTAPSGAGKTTIKTALLSGLDYLGFSISATTRGKREGETDGADYYFLTPDEFKTKINNGDFVEYEEVYTDQFYGTLYSELERNWNLGKTVILDIDVQGALSIKEKFADQSLVIFIQPPSLETLKKRLMARDTESEESLRKRITKAELEMQFAESFDTYIINDDLELAVLEAKSLVSDFVNG
jgi:guanylate kinase